MTRRSFLLRLTVTTLAGAGLCIALSAQPLAGEAVWQRTFEPLTFGDQEGPQNDGNFAGGRGSWNLTFHEGRIALIAADVPSPQDQYYLTILNATTGQTERSFPIRQDIGSSRSYLFPWAIVSASGDNPPGLVNLGWDSDTGILFTGQGAYESAYTAYRPAAEDPAAFAALAETSPALQDAFGRTKDEIWTTLGTDRQTLGMDADVWGLSGSYFGDLQVMPERSEKHDHDWETVWGRQGSTYYNTSGIFAIQPDGPLIGLAKGVGWGHNQAGFPYLFNKYTGMKMLAKRPEWPSNEAGAELRTFSSGGVVLGPEKLFLVGPAEDRNEDGQLGAKRPEGTIPRVDQGLAIWAYDLAFEDRRPNDGATGPAALDTVLLEPAFNHTFASTFTETEALESHGQSWYETDGFYRPKATAFDGEGLWMAWKPAQASGVALAYAGPDGKKTIDLGVGQGLKGVDIWPKLELVELGGQERRLVFATPTSRWRERIQPEDPEAFLEPFEYGRGNKKSWDELSERERQGNIDRVKGGGAWSPELSMPRGDAALAVADPETGEVLWTENQTERFPRMQINGFWTFIDRVHMAVVGNHAVVGWVDTSSGQARLQLAQYDLRSPGKPEPSVHQISLNFDGGEFPYSSLTDLAVHNGGLYALVTQGKRYSLRDPRWQAQHVIAIR
ncbi:MAG: hypothetical protein ACFB21_12150 [Opitutales bacterium]